MSYSFVEFVDLEEYIPPPVPGSAGKVLRVNSSETGYELGTSASGTSSPTVVSKTANYTAAVGDVVIADATGGDFTVTLPVPASGATVVVKNIGSGTVSVAHHTAELVEGDGTVGVGANQSYTLISDGTDWWKI